MLSFYKNKKEHKRNTRKEKERNRKRKLKQDFDASKSMHNKYRFYIGILVGLFVTIACIFLWIYIIPFIGSLVAFDILEFVFQFNPFLIHI